MWVDVSINDIRTCTHTCSLNVFEIDHLIYQIEIELKELQQTRTDADDLDTKQVHKIGKFSINFRKNTQKSKKRCIVLNTKYITPNTKYMDPKTKYMHPNTCPQLSNSLLQIPHTHRKYEIHPPPPNTKYTLPNTNYTTTIKKTGFQLPNTHYRVPETYFEGL